jgi:flagellar motor switch protein FliN/FliY
MAEDENKGLFSSLEISAIGEMMNISLGSAATAVSTVLDRRVNITTPRVSVETRHEFEFSDMEPALAVEITYIEGLEGNNLMLLRKSDVRKILEIMMMTEIPEDNFELDELSMSAVCELMNQMMGSAATAMSELLGEAVNISTPIAFEVEDPKAFNEKYFEDDHPMVIVSFDLEIEDCLDSEFMSLMGVGLVKKMISEFGITADVSDSGSSQSAPAAEPQSAASSQPNAAPQQQQQAPPAQDQQQYADPYQQQVPPMQGQPYADPYQQPYPGGMYPPYPYPPQYYAPPNQPRMINVQNMTGQFDNITQLTKAEEGNLDLIMSVPLQVSVEIGRTKKQVRDILSLSQGSLVVLDKLAGEQVDVFVNGQHVAKGDVVVVDDNFGVRITEIVKDPEQLIKGNQNG